MVWWVAPVVGAAYGSMFGLTREDTDAAMIGAILGAGAGFLVLGATTLPSIEMPKFKQPERRRPKRKRLKLVMPKPEKAEAKEKAKKAKSAEEEVAAAAGPPVRVKYAKEGWEVCFDEVEEHWEDNGYLNPQLKVIALEDNKYMINIDAEGLSDEEVGDARAEIIDNLKECGASYITIDSPALVTTQFIEEPD